MVLWVGFLGAVLATSQDKHLGIEFLNRMLRPKAALALKIVVEIFAVIVSALLAHAAYQFLMEGIAADELDLLGVSKRVYFLVIPAGFGLITLHFLLRVVRNAARLMSVARTGPSPETEEEA
jgi:TRAP-type C4-dicarboxylate transport system permease small subunit